MTIIYLILNYLISFFTTRTYKCIINANQGLKSAFQSPVRAKYR